MNQISAEDLGALLLSLRTAAFAVCLNAPPAIALGWFLARGGRKTAWLFEPFLSLPIVLPPVVTGYILLLLFGRRGPLGAFLLKAFHVSLPFTEGAVLLASLIVSFPFFARSARAAFALSDGSLEEASLVLGRGPAASFLRISLPRALPGLIGGGVLCFARALGEFGATISFAGNIGAKTRTLPLAIYTAMQSPGGDAQALRLTLLSAAIAFAAVFVSEIALGWGKNRKVSAEAAP